MNTYVLLFLLATFTSLGLTPLVRRAAEKFGWLDVPRDNRRVHLRAIPRLGGVAIFLSVALTLLSLLLVNSTVTAALSGQRQRLFAVLLSATIVFAFGVYDDLFGANSGWKFLAQGVAGMVLFILGGRIEGIDAPFIGEVMLPPFVSFAVTVVWVVGISNAFNLIDGMDGLATGAALFASLVMLVVSFLSGQIIVTVVAATLCGALIGFLRYNFNPASIFLGDSGSLFVGFILAALSIQGFQKASTAVAVAIPVLAFGLPILDTGIAIMRRFIGGRPLFVGDREHVHHMLLERGWSHRRVVFILYGVCAAFALCALLFTQEMGRTTGFVLLTIGVAVITTVGQLRYHEIDEIKASVKRNVADRRRRAKNNVRVRRASSLVAQAQTFDEVVAAVREMLDDSDFDFAVMQLRLAHAPQLEPQTADIEGYWKPTVGGGSDLQIANGTVNWTWTREGFDMPSLHNPPAHYWTLRVPITSADAECGFINFYHSIGSKALALDINCICNIFQPALGKTVGRLLHAPETKTVELAAPLKFKVQKQNLS